MRELVDLVGEEVAELGIEKEIAPIEQILANGTSADRPAARLRRIRRKRQSRRRPPRRRNN